MAYVETLYMRAQLKQEIKELRKLKKEVDAVRNNTNAGANGVQ